MGDASKRKSVLLIGVLLIFAACSTQKHYRTLSFFFDGVPNPDDAYRAAATDSLRSFAADSSTLFAYGVKPELFIHQPYLEKECASCHNQGRMGSLNESQPGLCYQCHSSFGTQYTFEHGPAAGGYCTECHNPHKAKEQKLLLRTGKDLCLECHESNQVFASLFHNISGETDCLACHNPHGSNNHSLMQQNTCYQCHDNFTEKHTVVHGPVAGSLCSACHTTHRGGTEHLLVHAGRDVCFYCHDARRLLEDETHSYIEDTNCTECHNPHGGDDRFMFN